MNLAEQTKKLLEILGDGFPLERLELILQHKEMILEWLESKEFKEKYAKHPYPPLMDPSKVVWEQTDPRIAWDFNLPLPPFYSILVSILPGAGGSAFYKFLTLCDVDCYSKWYGHHLAYLENYQIFSQSKNYKALIVTDFINPFTQKFWSLIDKKMPMLCLVGDVVKVLKTLVNHTRPIEQKPLVKRFNLTCDYTEIMPQIAYHCSNEKPNLEAVITDCISGLFRSIFCFKEKKEAIKPSEIIYIDAQEINAQNAFKTFSALSEKFGFNAPLEQDREVFSQRMNKNTSLTNAFPVVLYAHPQDIGKKRDFTTLGQNYMVGGGVNIMIDTQFDFNKKNALNLTQELLPKGIDNKNVVLSVKPQEAGILRAQPKLKKAVQKFLEGYFKEFKKREDEIASNLKSPYEVLEYFKMHKKQYNAMRKIFNEELAHIKQVRPDIVESWEYYQAFEKIAKVN